MLPDREFKEGKMDQYLWWGVVWSLPLFRVLASVGGFVIGFEWTEGPESPRGGSWDMRGFEKYLSDGAMPVSRAWHCQNLSKAAISASTRPSSDGCRINTGMKKLHL